MKTAKAQRTINPDKSLADLRKTLKAYHDFLVGFELVFGVDAEDTLLNLENGETLDLATAVCNPAQFDGDNWANRDILMSAYGRLKNLLGESFPE